MYRGGGGGGAENAECGRIYKELRQGLFRGILRVETIAHIGFTDWGAGTWTTKPLTL